MACTRTAICTLIALSLTSGCRSDAEHEVPERPEKNNSPIVIASSEPARDAGNPWVERQVADLRDRTLKWTPRDTPLQQMVFAGNTLFAVLGESIAVIDASGKSEMVRHPAPGSHQLIALADGAALALGPNGTLRIRPNAKAPEAVKQVLVFPQSLVYGSASDPARLDVFDVLSGQVLGFGPSAQPSFSSLWLPEVTLDVPELKQAHCGQLLDGTYACTASSQLLHLNPRSRAQVIGKLPAGLPIWRVLGGARADQVWLARSDGQLEKWWFGPPPKKLASIVLPWTPLDVALKRDTIAVVRIVQDRAKPKELTLVVLDTEGHQRFEVSLMPPADEDKNLAEREIRTAEVLVHNKRPWVAVRTSRGVRIVNAQTGETVVEAQ